MMKRLCIALTMVFSLASGAAAATVAVTTGNVNLRAGPSTGYPVVVVIPLGGRIVTHGCLPGFTWCDISFGAYRGWVAARYVQVVYNGAPVVLSPAVAVGVGLAIVAFDKSYWDTYYVSYPWYRSWSVYAVPPRAAYGVYPRARVDSYGRSVECAGGSCTAARGVTGIYGGSSELTRTCADGTCTATRNTVGPYGGTATGTRTCGNGSCSASHTGPAGNTVGRTRNFGR